MPCMRTPFTVSDAMDPVDSRMISGRSTPSMISLASPMRSTWSSAVSTTVLRSTRRSTVAVRPLGDGVDVDPVHHQADALLVELVEDLADQRAQVHAVEHGRGEVDPV